MCSKNFWIIELKLKGNSINNCDFFLKYIDSLRGSHCDYSHQGPKKPRYATGNTLTDPIFSIPIHYCKEYLGLQVHEWKMEPDKVKSKLEIDPATQMDAGLYECSADNMYSVDRRSFKTDFSIAFDWLLSLPQPRDHRNLFSHIT